MPQARITFGGELDTFITSASALAGVIPPIDKLLAAVKAVQDKHIDEAVRRGRTYPPKQPGQKYVRTGRIGVSWRKVRSHLTGDGIEASAYNTATEPARKGYRKQPRFYAPYVFGDAGLGIDQARVHQGRWVREQQLVDIPQYQRDMYAAIFQTIAGG